MEEIVITSLDRNLANDLQAEGIKDISVGRQISTMDCANPEIMAQMNSVVTLVVSGASTIALSLFSSWLYERLKNKPDMKTKINGIEVSGKDNDVKIQVNNYIQINFSENKSEK